jgi:hypothetical protein
MHGCCDLCWFLGLVCRSGALICKAGVGVCNADVSCVVSNVDRDRHFDRDGGREVRDMGWLKVFYSPNSVYIDKVDLGYYNHRMNHSEYFIVGCTKT